MINFGLFFPRCRMLILSVFSPSPILLRSYSDYNNYRLHSALGWKTPASRYTGRAMTLRGLAGIPGIEPMAAKPEYGPAYCDPPFEIVPFTAQRTGALAILPSTTTRMSNCV